MEHTKEPFCKRVTWFDAGMAKNIFGVDPYADRVLIDVKAATAAFSSAEFRDRTIDCLSAMEGIEDPAKLREQRDALRDACGMAMDVLSMVRDGLAGGGHLTARSQPIGETSRYVTIVKKSIEDLRAAFALCGD